MRDYFSYAVRQTYFFQRRTISERTVNGGCRRKARQGCRRVVITDVRQQPSFYRCFFEVEAVGKDAVTVSGYFLTEGYFFQRCVTERVAT